MEKTNQQMVDELGDQLLSNSGFDFSKPENKDSNKQDAGTGGKVDIKIDPADLSEQEKESKDGLQEEEKQEEVKEAQSEAKEEAEEQTEEDLIPKSKYEKMVSRMNARIDSLTSQLKQQEAAKPTLDSTRAKLEQLSEKELATLEDEIDDGIYTARMEGDTAKLSQLRELRRTTRDVLQTAPKRFVEKQIKAANETIQSLANDPLNEDIDFQKEGKAILDIANQIYTKKTDLQGLVRGQALAIELASEYYRDLRKTNQGKAKEDSLKRELTKQKQKTSLNTSKSTGVPKNVLDTRKLYAKAKNGDKRDKEAFFENIIDVDEYLR